MISKKIKLLLFIIFSVSIFKMILVIFSDNEKSVDEKTKISGVITYIKKDSEKTVFDIKNKKKYRITCYEKFNYKLGDKLLVYSLIKNPDNNTVFNLFNYRKYLLSKKIDKVGICFKIKLINKNKNILYKIKNSILKRIKKYKSKAYLKTFILADTSDIEADVKDTYRKNGISHLFAVSGMHVSIFLCILNFLLKKIRFKNIIIFLFLIFFVFITNFSESLLRCVLFIFLAFINKKLKLNINNLYLIILTFSILIIYNPYFIYNVGFLFSVTITFFVILSSKLIKDKNYLKKTFIISFICFLSSVPILAYSFFRINFLSPIFNLFFVPFVSFVIFPVGLLTFLFPCLDDLFVFFINGFEYISLILSKLTMLSFAISKPSFFVITLYYIFLFLSIKYSYKYILFYMFLIIININSRFFINDVKITFLDVKQGDSLVAIFPRGDCLVIDTGGNMFNKSSIVFNKTIPYLNSMGITRIKELILTHGDFDHMGEAINLVNNFKVEKVIFNCGPYNDLEKELIKVLDQKKIKYYSCINELNIDKNKLYFLQTKEYDNENDNSNVIYTELNGYKFMFMGDAGVTTEKEIMSKYNLPNIDVLKAGHHGSRTSSSIEFINEINPKYSIISVGKNNRYGHPNKEVLENLNNSKIYRTDEDGSIIFKIKNNKLKIETCSP